MSSTDPERYDLHQMMDRLKNRSSSENPEDGEMVTRSDGSTAIRVRRRKRRSHQPHKDRQRRIHFLQISALLLVIFGLLLVAGFLTIYVNTSPFRKQLVTKIQLATGADVDLQQFRMNPTGANAGGADLAWPAGNMLQSLTLRALHADVSPLTAFGGRLGGGELKAHTGKLSLSFPEQGQPLRIVAAQQGEPAMRFRQYSVKDFQAQLLGENHAVIRLQRAEATFIPADQHEGQASMLRLSRGELSARHWPELHINRAHIEFTGKRAQVVGLRLKHPDDDNGGLELSGPLAPYEQETTTELQVGADAFLLSGLLGDELGKILVGRVDAAPEIGTSKLEVRLGDRPHARLAVLFQGSLDHAMEVQNLPFLFALSQTLGDEWFSRPEFLDVVSGAVLREADWVELRELELSSRERMVVRGTLRSERGRISGELAVGLKPGIITASDNKVLDAMFGEWHEGHRWISLQISGTSSQLRDDFSAQYQRALEGLKEPSKAATPGEGTPPGFEELTRPR